MTIIQSMNKSSMKAKCFFAVSLSSLLLGGMIYLLFRPHTYIALIVSNYIQFDRITECLRWMNCGWVKFYLADYLWALSLSGGLHLIFQPDRRGTVWCALTVISYGGIYELLQQLNWISGTGDLWDLLMYILAALTANILNLSLKE